MVQDGLGDSDIDFQQSLTIQANWHNFLDRESGILLYQYGFAKACLDDSFFHFSGEGEVTEIKDRTNGIK